MSQLEVDKVIPQSGTTLTLGESGDTVSIPSGATFTPTLTAPIIDEINDNNGNEEIIFTTTTSAVNELTIANAATGNAPEIAATGDDTDIDLKLTPKGAGNLVLDGIEFPNADGSANQALVTNGSGVLSFAAVGGTNTPAFLVRNSSTQSLSDDTVVKAQFNTVVIDTASAYDNVTNYRFTVPSGEDGRYFIYAMISLNSEVNSNLDGALAQIRKNGSDITGAGVEFQYLNNPIRYCPVVTQTIVDLVATDYIEVFTRIEATDSTGGTMMTNSTFGGYKLIS
jgi:hypothetical protein